MFVVEWTFDAPPGVSRAELVRRFTDSATRYLSVPGLMRKYFGVSEDGKLVVGIYIWKSKDVADAYHAGAWRLDVEQRWGRPLRRAAWEVPIESDGVSGLVVRDSS